MNGIIILFNIIMPIRHPGIDLDRDRQTGRQNPHLETGRQADIQISPEADRHPEADRQNE
jgi:hypothetical protein